MLTQYGVLSAVRRSLLSIRCLRLMQNYFLYHPISNVQFYDSQINYSCRSLLSPLPVTAPKSYFLRKLHFSSFNATNSVQNNPSIEPATSRSPKPDLSSGSELTSNCPSSPVPASLRRTVDEYFIQYQPTRAPEETVTSEEASRVLTVPNALSFVRLLSGPIVGYLIFNAQLQIAAPIFLFAAITDWVVPFYIQVTRVPCTKAYFLI